MARALVVALLIFSPQRVLAIDKVWKNTSTNFNASGSWTPSGIPGSGDVADFNSAMVSQPNLSGSLTIQELNFSVAASSGYDLTSSNTGVKLTLTNTGTGATSAINAANTSGTNTIDAPIILGAAGGQTQTFTQANGGTLVVNGVISSTNTVTLSLAGTGIIKFSGTNTYAGATTVSAGILNIQNASALGTTASGTTVASGATLQLQNSISVGAEALTISGTGASGQNGALVNVSGTNNYAGLLTLGAATTISSDSGTLNLTNTGTITGATFGLTLTGSGSGSVSSIIGTTSGTLTKSGTGTWTLSGVNTYTGTTTINAGTLSVTGSLASGSAVTVNNSGSVLEGTGTINGSVSIASSGAILEAGTGSTGQTLTMKGAVTMGSGSVIALALGASSAHSTLAIGVGGSISFQSLQKFNIIDLGVTSGSTYNGLVTGIGSDPGTESGWTIANQSWAYNFSYDSANGGEIDLTITAVPEPSTWIAAGLALVAVGYNQRNRIGRRSFGVVNVFSSTP
jgi:autotransporter-associated beta strand protein